MDLANALRSAFELMGCEVEALHGLVSRLDANAKSEILDVLTGLVREAK